MFTSVMADRRVLRPARLVSGKLLVLAAGLCTCAQAQHVRIEYWSGESLTFVADFASGQTINTLPTVGAGVTRINAYSVDGLADLGPVIIKGGFVPASTGTPLAPDIMFVLGEGEAPESAITPAFANISSITAEPAARGRLMLIGAAAGNVSGQWRLGAIKRFNVNGNCAADIELISPGTAIEELSAGTLTGRVAALTGNIIYINSVGPLSLVPGATISAFGGIGAITAPSINATIVANAFGGNGDLNYIAASVGDISGRVQCNNLRNPEGEIADTVMLARGRISANIVIDGDLYGTVFSGAGPGLLPTVTDIKIGGDMRGSITSRGSIGSVTIAGSIRLDPNSFVLPVIQSTEGTLLSLNIDGDVEGDGPFLPTIRGNEIGTVRIAGDCYANITRIGGGPVNVKDVMIAGDFSGDFSLGTFQRVIIGNNLHSGGVVRFAQGIPANRIFVIGGSWEGAVVCSHPRGLLGQIIVNAGLGAATPWQRLAPLHLPAQSPSPFARIYYVDTFPEYSAIVGGGCVGSVPFSLRGGDCWPRSNATVLHAQRRIWPADGTIREVITIAMSGPVVALDNQPLTILTTDAPFLSAGGAAMDVTHRFDVLVAPPGRQREIWLSPRPVSAGGPGTLGTLRDYYVTSSGAGIGSVSPLLVKPAATQPFVHHFSVGGFDLNIDGKIGSDDVIEYSRQPHDFTADGVANGDDLTLIRAASQE